MQITRNSIETAAGPSDWFTGAVYIDAIAAPSAGSRLSASSVHFTPGARTAWHTHPNGQTIWVTEGVGLCQRRGGPIEVIRPGDRVFFETGDDVRTVAPGDLVVMPFAFSDGTCVFCREGLQTSCVHGGFFGTVDVAGAQAEAVRVPQADGTLFALPVGEDDELMPSLLTLSDVMGTGHHAAVTARVGPGKSAVVVGDGAVGLCGVIAAKRLGAEQIIIMGRHDDRIALAREFGATDVVSERGTGAVERMNELTAGYGVDAVLECV